MARKHPSRVPSRAVKFVALWETGGVLPNNGYPYNDPAGYATTGYGHLIALRGVTQGDIDKWGQLTERQARMLLAKDLESAAMQVRRLITVPLNRRQFSALISFVYNLGAGALEESTLRRLLNDGNYASVPHQLSRWNQAGGVVMQGLTNRRRAEGRMFRPLRRPNPLFWR